MEADKEERIFARTTALPHDPLANLGKNDPFNLPLTAFCYLIRRLSVRVIFCPVIYATHLMCHLVALHSLLHCLS